MKKCLKSSCRIASNRFLVCVCFFFCTSFTLLFAQSKYLPIVTSRNEWVTYDASGDPIVPFNTTSSTYTSDSFLLDNKYYFKGRSKNNNLGSGEWKIGTSYIREQNRIVYFKTNELVPEKVLFNFNLGVGDTLPPIGNSGIRIVEKISTVTFLDGIPRMKMTMAKPCFATIIEGIGDMTSSSFWNCSGLIDIFTSIRCFSTDGKLVYKSVGNEGCYTKLAVKDVDVRINNIYPNPSTGLLNIEIEDVQSIKNVAILDHLGRIVAISSTNIQDNSIQLDISNLDNGLYIGKILFQDGSKTGFKIVKTEE